MDITRQHQERQQAKRLQGRISSFFGDFQIGTLLNKSGIRKLRGVSPLTLFSVIFMLPFEGNNFYRGIVTNGDLPFKKNAAYELLKNPRHNWRKFMLAVVVQVATISPCSPVIRERKSWFLMTVPMIDPVPRLLNFWPGFSTITAAQA